MMQSWKKLKGAIRDAVAIAETESETAIVRNVRETHAELIEQWVTEKLAALVRAELRRLPDTKQLFLPGFKDLARKLPLTKGEMQVGEMNITQLRESAKVIVRYVSKHYVPPKAAKILHLVSLMQPYSRLHRGLTVNRYYEIRAEELAQVTASRPIEKEREVRV